MQITDLIYIDSTGYHYADYPSFLSWIQDQYRAIYGADIYLEADSQDGQWLAVLAKAFYDTAAIGSASYNSFSPATAQGVGLSRVVKINGLSRQLPSKSTVTLTIVGQAGTVITNGVATDALQQKWNLPVSVTIPGGGTIDVVAEADVEGAVNAEAATITTIFTPTRGWQTVNNVAAATPGAAVESDAALRIRQALSTAIPSLTVLDGTTGSVANVPGVTKVAAYENDTDTTDANGIPEHSISMVVAGGDDTAVAQAIQVHKTPGTGTYGDTTVNVHDSHGMPIAISFQRAVPATISVEVTVAAGTGWSTDYIPLIEAAVAAVVNDNAIGAEIFYTKFFSPAYLNGVAPVGAYDVSLIRLKKNAGSFSAANITLAWDEEPVCDADTNVTVIVT